MNPIVEEIIDQLKAYRPKQVILFGSYAKGQFHKDSDVDLVIIKKTTDLFHERQKKARLTLKTTTPVDLFIFTPEEFERARTNNILIKEVFETGRVVYG